MEQALLVDTLQPYPVFEDRAARHVASSMTLLDAVCGHDVPVLRTSADTASEGGRRRSARLGPSNPATALLKRGHDHVEKHRETYRGTGYNVPGNALIRCQNGHSIAVAGDLWDCSGIMANPCPTTTPGPSPAH